MPTNRRARTRQQKDNLLARVLDGDRPVSRATWRQHRETLMKWEGREGQRPVEWWLYEKKMWPPDEREAEVLFEMGELKGVELQKLMEHWREEYEKALQSDFAFCVGHLRENDTFASWLEGDEAREAHYNLVGIPRSLIKRWDEELR